MSLRHALLIALSNEACTGYEITHRFENSLGFFWHATHQQIYRELGKMAEEGLVSFTVIEQTDKPSKKVYRPTELGLKTLTAWVSQPLPETPIKDALLMKLFTGHLADAHALRSEMEQHRKTHRISLELCQSIEREHFSNVKSLPLQYRFQYLTLRFGIRYFTTWLEWSNDVMSLLDEATVG